MSNEDTFMQMQHLGAGVAKRRLRGWNEVEIAWIIRHANQTQKYDWEHIVDLFKKKFKYERSLHSLKYKIYSLHRNGLLFQTERQKQFFSPKQNELLLSLYKQHGRNSAEICSTFTAQYPLLKLTPRTLYQRIYRLSHQPMHQSTPDQSTPDQSIVDQWPVAETADSYTVTENTGNNAGADLFDQLLGTT
jgi:hypothetical protein